MRILIFYTILFLILPLRAFPIECNLKNFNLSKLEIDLLDKDYLEMVMGFSYGPKIKNFIPHLNTITSNFYYQDSKDLPLMTFLTANYKTEKAANEAYIHLKSKWDGNANNQYEVLKKGKVVTLFGNNRLDKECFLKISKNTKI